MPRFFIQPTGSEAVIIDENQSKHIIKTLRMKIDDKLILTDGNGFDYDSVITNFDNNLVYCKILNKLENLSESNTKTTLFQALPKNDKMELIVQKAVELGVYEIYPVLTSRCISRPDEKTIKKKIERYNRIAFEACKQSGRGIITKVNPLINFEQALEKICLNDLGILFYENSKNNISSFYKGNLNSIGVMIGCVGGFDEKEIQKATNLNINIATLGNRILRCETAPIVALSVLNFLNGEF